MNEHRQLHDATLKEIFLDWEKGSFTAKFIMGSNKNEIFITGEGIKSFSYNRVLPWGRSVSVYKCQIESNVSPAILTITMQSGDKLIGKGDAFFVSM